MPQRINFELHHASRDYYLALVDKGRRVLYAFVILALLIVSAVYKRQEP